MARFVPLSTYVGGPTERASLVAAGGAFCVFALAAPPSWYWLDSAELSAAGAAMGSAHPTGFPFYTWMARLASLVPLGEIAFRINLLSALCGAVAVGFTAQLVAEVTRPEPPDGPKAASIVSAVSAGALLGAGLTFFRQATVAEVYAPTAAALAATLWLFHRVARGAGATTGLALALVAGLGLGLHSSFRLLMGMPIAALLVVRLWHGARWPLAAPALTAGIAGALHAYLPVRSATGRIGALDWGHPRTADAFVEHALTAGRIRSAFADEILSGRGDKVARDAATFADQLVNQLGPLVTLAVVGGLVWLFRRRGGRWLAAALLVVLLGDAAYSVFINPMGLVDLQNGVPLAVGASVAVGVGLSWFGRIGGRGGPYLAGAAGVLLILPVLLVDHSARWAAASGEAPRRWTEAVLASVPARGIAIASEDSTAAGAFFATAVEGARPDVAVLVRQHLRDVRRNRAVLDHAKVERSDVEPRRVLATLAGARRPVAWEMTRGPTPPGLRLGDGAPLVTLVGADAQLSSTALRHGLELVIEVFSGDDSGDPQARERFARALVGLGRRGIDRGDWEAARVMFDAAVDLRPEHVAALVNRGVVAGRDRDFARAAELTDRALALEPDNRQALVNGARFALRRNQDGRALELLERALELYPWFAPAWELAGVADARAKRYQRARQRLERALELDPGNAGARETLRKLPR